MPWIHWVCPVVLLTIAPLGAGGCESSPLVSPPRSATPPIVSPSQIPLATSQRPARAEPSPIPVSESKIWAQLRQGKGYVILFRHALAPGTGDPANFRLDDCSTQRNLSKEGQQQAVRIGEVLRQQNISVSRVLSSQWCRCLETAKLMNVGPVEPFPALNSFFRDRRTERSQTEQLRQFILESRDQAGVMIMVTHQVNITAISDIVPQSGAAIVMRASSPSQVQLIGQLNPL